MERFFQEFSEYRRLMKVLILNHQHVECGVYQFAKRIYDIAKRSDKVEYFHASVSNKNEYLSILNQIKPQIIIYNWHFDRMPWLKARDIRHDRKTKHCFIYHEGITFREYDKYLFFGDLDPNKKACIANKRIILPRPLFDYNGPYPQNEIPTIGSFGFAFNHKRFELLVKLVNDSFDQAIINIHMPNPYFGDTTGNRLEDIKKLCHKHNIKPNIKLNITSFFIDDKYLLQFLARNDINVFHYGKGGTTSGISSATDYALSVQRPIAITNYPIFRHLFNKNISLEHNTLQEIMARGTKPLEEFYKMWSTDEFSQQIDNFCLSL